MKLLVPIIVALLAGIGTGIGVGIMMTKPKVEENKTRISDLEAKVIELQDQNKQLQSSSDESNAAVRKATQESVRLKNAYEAVINQLNVKLENATTELAALKNGTPTETPAGTAPTESTVTAGTPTVATVDYVVQEGDSLWKIAANELDNGMRYKEILELNSTLSEDKPLIPGTKIKLPSQ